MNHVKDKHFPRGMKTVALAVIVGSGSMVEASHAQNALVTPVQGQAKAVVGVATQATIFEYPSNYAEYPSNYAEYPSNYTPWELAIKKYDPYIEHQSEVWIGETPYTILKLDFGNGKFREVALTPDGREINPTELTNAYRKQFEPFGRVHPTLSQELRNPSRKVFDVMVWLNIDPPQPLAKPERLPEGYEEQVLWEIGERYEKVLGPFLREKQEILAQLKLSSLVDKGTLVDSPFVRIGRLGRDRVEALAQSTLVKMLLLYDPDGREDLADAMAIANADDVQAAGITGNGVKVGVFEARPTSTTNLNIVDSYSASAGITPSTSDHAQHVSAIINSSNAVSGFAPDTDFYAADDYDLAALDWAVDDVRTSALNQSFHRAAEIGDGLQADDLYKDYKVLHYPWPTIVQAAGNWCPPGTTCDEGGSDVTDEFVNHKGYNSISIGNHNDSATQVSASSCFVNPTSTHDDRELPELAANGTFVTADGMTKSGTSMASPAVTGSVALLQERQRVLRIWPEGVRALLFAGSTTNVPTHAGTLAGGGSAANAPNTWWRDVSLGNDGFDGAGALNIQRSVGIAGTRWTGETTTSGWDIGLMTEGRFDNRYFEREYRVRAPNWAWFRPHIKVALAWDSTATLSGSDPAAVYASELEMDLDIRVYDSSGTKVAHSLSWDNSYEIVDFDARAGETYTIKVHRWSTKPGAWTWYGIAWDTTWTVPPLIRGPIVGERLFFERN